MGYLILTLQMQTPAAQQPLKVPVSRPRRWDLKHPWLHPCAPIRRLPFLTVSLPMGPCEPFLFRPPHWVRKDRRRLLGERERKKEREIES